MMFLKSVLVTLIKYLLKELQPEQKVVVQRKLEYIHEIEPQTSEPTTDEKIMKLYYALLQAKIIENNHL